MVIALGSLLFDNLHKGHCGFPANRIARTTDFRVQLIYLLQGKSLGLVDHEVNETNTEEAASEPNEENL
jgi:hypothetical protein